MKGKCEAEVTDLSAEVALNRDDTRVERRKRANNGDLLKCLIVLPCGIIMGIVVTALFLIKGLIYMKMKVVDTIKGTDHKNPSKN